MPFRSLDLHPSLLRGIKELGFARPTPIQASAIPPALEGRDVLACAATGSGKSGNVTFDYDYPSTTFWGLLVGASVRF